MKYILSIIFCLLAVSPSYAIIDPITIGTALGYSLIAHTGVLGVWAAFTKPDSPATVTPSGTLIKPGTVIWVEAVNGVPTAMTKDITVAVPFNDFKNLNTQSGVTTPLTDAFNKTFASSSYGQNNDYSGIIGSNTAASVGKTILVNNVAQKINLAFVEQSDALFSGSLVPLTIGSDYIQIQTLGSASNKRNVYDYFFTSGVTADVSPVVPAGTTPTATPAEVYKNLTPPLLPLKQAELEKDIIEAPTPLLIPPLSEKPSIGTDPGYDPGTDPGKWSLPPAALTPGGQGVAGTPTTTSPGTSTGTGTTITTPTGSTTTTNTNTPITGLGTPLPPTSYGDGSTSDFGGRFNTFTTDMKSGGLFALPGQVLGNIPSSTKSSFDISFGRLGSTTFDLASYGSSIALIRILVLFIFSITGFKIITLKGGSG